MDGGNPRGASCWLVVRIAPAVPSDYEIKTIAKILAKEEWPLATEQEKSDWSEAHWIKWVRQARAAIIAVRKL